MRKLILILSLFIYLVPGFGQDLGRSGYSNSITLPSIQTFKVGGVYQSGETVPIWTQNIINDYLAINNHFDDDYASEVSDYLLIILDDDYIMPDESDNYYTIFGPDGQNKTTADFFYVLKFDGNLTTQPTLKTGDLLKWHIGDTIYSQANDVLPNHTFVEGDSLLIVSSTDGFDGVETWRIDNNNFVGNRPKMIMPNVTNFYVNTNDFDGIIPNDSVPNVASYFVYSSKYDSFAYKGASRYVIDVDNWINTNLGLAYMNINQLPQKQINKILEQTALYFASNEPVKNLTLRIAQSVATPPTCGDYNTDKLRLDSIYADAGFTFTATKDAGSTGTLLTVPRIALPDTISILTGESYIIYDDAVAAKHIGEYALNVSYSCDIGHKSYYGYEFNEADEDTGYYKLVVTAKQCNTLSQVDSTIVKLIKPGGGTGIKTICIIGNSLTANGATHYVGGIRTGLSGITPTMVGSKGTAPNNHEGIAGYGYNSFLINTSPFYYNGVIDFNHYRTQTLGLSNPIDIVLIQLGINDIISDTRDTTWIKTELIDSVKSLVDKILLDATEGIIIAMPPKCENTGDGWYSNYGISRNQNYYIDKMSYLWEKLNETFSGRRYNYKVTISQQGVMVDRNNGYPKINGLHSNGVHPTTLGYQQNARAAVCAIEYILETDW